MYDGGSCRGTRVIVTKVAIGAAGVFNASKELVAHIRDQRLGLWDAMAEENAKQALLCKTADYAGGFERSRRNANPSSPAPVVEPVEPITPFLHRIYKSYL